MSKKKYSIELNETDQFWLDKVLKHKKQKSMQEFILSAITEEYRKLNR